MSALEILSNQQSDYRVSLNLDGTAYSHSNDFACDAEPRLSSNLVFTRSTGSAFESPGEDTLGSVRLVNGVSYPLTDEFTRSLINKPFSFDVFGTVNKDLFDEQTAYYDQRIEFISGKVDAVSYSDEDFLVVFGSGYSSLKGGLLTETNVNAGVNQSDDFNFTAIAPSIVQSTSGDIGVGSSYEGVNAPINFDTDIERLELSVESLAEPETHTAFHFVKTGYNTAVSEKSITITVTINQISTDVDEVVIQLSKPVKKFRWMMRQVFGDVYDYSHTPVSIDLANSGVVEPEGSIVDGFPNTQIGELASDSVITWDNLPAVTTISFKTDANADTNEVDIDRGGKVYCAYYKMWLIEAVEAGEILSNVSFSPAADISPTGTDLGVYIWENLNDDTVRLYADFVGTVDLTPDGNKITYGNDDDNLVIDFQYAKETDSENLAKIFRPIAFGSPKNITPADLGNDQYDPGLTVTDVVACRSAGVDITRQTDYSNFLTDLSNDVEVYYYGAVPDSGLSIFDPTGFRLLISGGLTDITCDAETDITTFREAMEYLLEETELTLGTVDSIFADEEVSIYITEQINIDDYINNLLALIDCTKVTKSGVMSIESRKTFSMDSFEQEINSDEIEGSINVSTEKVKYHKYKVTYNPNHTVQENVLAYRQPGQIVEKVRDDIKYSDYPTNTVLSGSVERDIAIPFKNASIANYIVNKLDRDCLRRHECTFTTTDRQWSITNNRRTELSTHLLPDGMFLPESTTDETNSIRSSIRGTYYVAP